MNAKDFRIGNYYFPTDGSGFYKEVTAHELVAWASGAVFGKPIYLTSEWLERFGFENSNNLKKSDSFFFVYVGASELHINPDNGVVWIERGNNIFNNPVLIEYVHQLQNLFFALTGKELQLRPK